MVAKKEAGEVINVDKDYFHALAFNGEDSWRHKLPQDGDWEAVYKVAKEYILKYLSATCVNTFVDRFKEDGNSNIVALHPKSLTTLPDYPYPTPHTPNLQTLSPSMNMCVGYKRFISTGRCTQLEASAQAEFPLEALAPAGSTQTQTT